MVRADRSRNDCRVLEVLRPEESLLRTRAGRSDAGAGSDTDSWLGGAGSWKSRVQFVGPLQMASKRSDVPHGQNHLAVGYVGSFGRHLERAYELNPALPGACAPQPAVGIAPSACVASTGARSQQGFFWPQDFKYPAIIPGSVGADHPNGILAFGSVGQQATDGNSKYSSLQASLNKRISHGLSFLLSYTYAHAQDNGSSFESSSFGTRGTNPFIDRLNWGDSQFDARHRFVASYQYEIPVPHKLTSNGDRK